jgi:hypothetical protein
MGTPLTSVSGIGPAAAKVLAEHGFASAEQLAASVIEDLVKVPGFGAARAATTLRAARSLVERVAETPPPAAASAAPGKQKKGPKKKTKDKGNSKAKSKKGKGKKDKNKKGKKDKKKSATGKRRKDAKPRKGGKRRKK